jgi:AraC family transcriptional regulator, regulatory protein of adaptative response / methylated-DNA-[protein]-cysteine methyltransferase
MSEQQDINYRRIAEAIVYIRTNFKDQPDLDKVAEMVHLSPFHFQRLFVEWVGTSPKKFLQYTSIEYAKTLLKKNQMSLSEAAFETGLSGTGRLHDLFINIEGMTPAEYKNGGKNLQICFSFGESPFGKIIVASTAKGICYMAFTEDVTSAIAIMQNHFPNACFRREVDSAQQNALSIFTSDWTKIEHIKLHLKGTDFQLKVWETLLKIPMGQLTTYGTIASKLNNPNASRAVGTAIGSNPVAFLIPCHRVIQANGEIGGYMWGLTRKIAIIGWEGIKTNSEFMV